MGTLPAPLVLSQVPWQGPILAARPWALRLPALLSGAGRPRALQTRGGLRALVRPGRAAFPPAIGVAAMGHA